jgi:hypothetical protein
LDDGAEKGHTKLAESLVKVVAEKLAEQKISDLKNALQQSEEKSTYEVTDKAKDDVSITITNAMFNKKTGR